MAKTRQRHTSAGLGMAAGAGFAAVLASLGSAPIAGADPAAEPANPFEVFSTNITDNLTASVAGDDHAYSEHLGALQSAGNPAALAAQNEVSGSPTDQLANADATDLTRLTDAVGTDGDLSANAAVLAADVPVTNQLFGIFNDNITDGVALADAGITQTYADYLAALPSVDDPAAFFGMMEVSAQLLEQQGNAALTELSGLIDVLKVASDPTNAPVVDLSDGLAGVTNMFDGFSSNTFDILNSTGTAVNETYTDFVGALPSVPTVSAFIAMVESSAEILSAQGQAYVTDVAGYIAALAAGPDVSNVSAAEFDPSVLLGAVSNQFDVLSENLTENWTATQDFFDALGSNPLGAFESGFELLESLLQGTVTDLIGFTGALGADLGLVVDATF